MWVYTPVNDRPLYSCTCFNKLVRTVIKNTYRGRVTLDRRTAVIKVYAGKTRIGVITWTEFV